MNGTLKKRLTAASERLNEARDNMAAEIKALDTELKNLNIGISVWVPFSTSPNVELAVGYAKINQHWGLALQITKSGLRDAGIEQWLYSDAPTYIRTDAATRIPELLTTIEKLAIEAAVNLEEAARKLGDMRRERDTTA